MLGGETLGASLGGPLAIYRCPNKKADGYAVYTNMVPGGGFRGYGSSQTCYAIECAMDELAIALKMDPFALRRKNIVKPGDLIESVWHDPSDASFGSYGLDECIDVVEKALASGRGQAKPDGDDWLEGTGVALAMLESGPPTEHRSGAKVELRADGTYHLAVGTTEMGNGSTTSHRQMAAAVLGSQAGQIDIINADTDQTPYDTGTFASTGTVVAGKAVVLAAEALRDRINEFASRQLGVPLADCRLEADAVVAGSKRMLLTEESVDVEVLAKQLETAGEPLDLEKFAKHVQADYIPHTVIIDCTASAAVAGNYAAWLQRGIHVVTPNKKANSGPMPYYRAMQEARRAAGTHYLYEATVGAGLPIIQTLRDLRETGDVVTRIEGIFSGTLAYLFNVYDGSEAFSSIVRAAKLKGYTEPDPRDDLSGMDVARKLIILGREMGLTLEMSDVVVKGLVPKALDSVSVEEFMARLPEFDAEMAAMLADARSKHQVLRYVGRIDADGTATVSLTYLDAKHAFANIALTDNVVRFATRRYCDNPLIVQGPGAGPEVTAGGVFSDLLRLSAYLGAHL